MGEDGGLGPWTFFTDDSAALRRDALTFEKERTVVSRLRAAKALCVFSGEFWDVVEVKQLHGALCHRRLRLCILPTDSDWELTSRARFH